MDNNMENKVVHLRLDDIIPNRFQPREVFDEAELEELAESIREHGIIQPIIVRQIGDKYELIAGERRSKASAMAGFTTIPAIIRNMDDKESAKVSLLENLQRKNLSAIEEARTYERIIDLDNMTQSELARTMGKSQPMIANKLRLLTLPEEVQNALIKNQISERHARSLLNVKDKAKQIELLDKIRAERMTVRELESYIKNMNNPPAPSVSNEFPTNFQSLNNEPIPSPIDNNFLNQTNTNQQKFDNFSSSFGNFNNMGLNDYQTSVNSNMFNNMPSNNQFQNPFSNQTNNKFNNLSTNSISSDNNSMEFNYETFNEPKNSSFSQDLADSFYQGDNNQLEANTNQPTSLASMFEGNSNNNYVSNEPNNLDNKNIFISQIKENEVRSGENQFLPNFSDGPIDNNGQPLVSENKNDYDDFNAFNNTTLENNNSIINTQENNSNNVGNTLYNSNFNNMKNASSTTNSVPDYFSTNSMEYQNNQGDLFNQPLNIVAVPTNQSMDYPTSAVNDFSDNTNFSNDINNSVEESESHNLALNDFNPTQEELNNFRFDNPLDDKYENILFAQPVAINQMDEVNNNLENQESKASDSVEVIEEKTIPEITPINEEEPSTVETNSLNKEEKEKEDKPQYITLDPVRTIFTTHDAVYELKKTTDRIKKDGINLESEEINFDDYYQIIIKIKKEMN